MLDDTIYCQKCGQPFLVKETKEKGPKTIRLHSSFENKNPSAVDEEINLVIFLSRFSIRPVVSAKLKRAVEVARL